MPLCLGWDTDPTGDDSPPDILVPGLLLSDIASGATRMVEAPWMHALYKDGRETYSPGTVVVNLREAGYTSRLGIPHIAMLTTLIAQIIVIVAFMAYGSTREGALLLAASAIRIFEVRQFGRRRRAMANGTDESVGVLVRSAIKLSVWLQKGCYSWVQWQASSPRLGETSLPSRDSIVLDTSDSILDRVAAACQFANSVSIGFIESILPDSDGSHAYYQWILTALGPSIDLSLQKMRIGNYFNNPRLQLRLHTKRISIHHNTSASETVWIEAVKQREKSQVRAVAALFPSVLTWGRASAPTRLTHELFQPAGHRDLLYVASTSPHRPHGLPTKLFLEFRMLSKPFSLLQQPRAQTGAPGPATASSCCKPRNTPRRPGGSCSTSRVDAPYVYSPRDAGHTSSHAAPSRRFSASPPSTAPHLDPPHHARPRSSSRAPPPSLAPAVLEQLAAQSRFPVLIAIDDFQALYGRSLYRDPFFHFVRPHRILMPRLLEYPPAAAHLHAASSSARSRAATRSSPFPHSCARPSTPWANSPPPPRLLRPPPPPSSQPTSPRPPPRPRRPRNPPRPPPSASSPQKPAHLPPRKSPPYDTSAVDTWDAWRAFPTSVREPATPYTDPLYLHTADPHESCSARRQTLMRALRVPDKPSSTAEVLALLSCGGGGGGWDEMFTAKYTESSGNSRAFVWGGLVGDVAGLWVGLHIRLGDYSAQYKVHILTAVAPTLHHHQSTQSPRSPPLRHMSNLIRFDVVLVRTRVSHIPAHLSSILAQITLLTKWSILLLSFV
ncbi:hypothetical protein C8J57DRAFT_1718769 [Mycena rebaudengoi]|nr:hypothetical protein C8J57DRAFT_1718769 [Mycena rebaudengoi]